MLKAIGLVVVVGVCASCAGQVRPVLNTPSGYPEVTIRGATVANVWAQLADEMISAGYFEDTMTDYQAVFFSDRVPLRVRMVGYQRIDVVFRPRQKPGALHIRAGFRLPAPGGGSKLTPLHFGPGRRPERERAVQAILERVRAALEGQALPPVPPSPQQ